MYTFIAKTQSMREAAALEARSSGLAVRFDGLSLNASHQRKNCLGERLTTSSEDSVSSPWPNKIYAFFQKFGMVPFASIFVTLHFKWKAGNLELSPISR